LKKVISLLEVVLFVVIIALCLLWYFNPNGNFEPVIVCLSTLLALYRVISRNSWCRSFFTSESQESIENINFHELSDEQFLMVDKLINLPLRSTQYLPEDEVENSVCNSLVNIGFFVFKDEVFELSPTGKKFLVTNGKNA